MSGLAELLGQAVDNSTVPGAVALVTQGEKAEFAAAGSADLDGRVPMARDGIFRIASITKPVTAAAAMLLVEDGKVALDDAVREWLPELAAPVVVRTPQSPVDDVVPAERPITLYDLLTFRPGYGFPSDFSLPAAGLLMEKGQRHMLEPSLVAPPDEWLATLATIPMLAHPGTEWLYNTGSDILGVLIARLSGRPLDEFMADRIFEPLGMPDTAFWVPPEKMHRFVPSYTRQADGALALRDAPDGHWSEPPAFPSGGGGLVSTADDWTAFGRMLLVDGLAPDGRRLLSRESVKAMTSNHITPEQRDAARLFLGGQGWGFGAAVDVDADEPWRKPGRYWWTGGSGTTAQIDPSTGTVAVLLTQVEMESPAPTPLMTAFWTHANQRSGRAGPGEGG
ncbi:serine hydrolase domain-containing protein [Actinomadura rupiterrae]|uniref:serine hydrolase domain-containing protein n=1 Tax=Actinomadura rupiterrae TaxID=559627 RepID=UPI0020A2351F|nr:serine hydrolase domain-containing protein [Actinomadura rupiterrae]MCP2335087.1 CubicO group peptidase (beta-lactamase class C family) [Actinomadura rupiterrae]